MNITVTAIIAYSRLASNNETVERRLESARAPLLRRSVDQGLGMYIGASVNSLTPVAVLLHVVDHIFGVWPDAEWRGLIVGRVFQG